jgi:WD40 repeat protein
MSKLISAQRALSLYREALQRGDLDSVAAILWLAECDPLLLDLINKFHQSHDISESVVSDAPQPTDKITGSLTTLKPSPNGLPPITVYQEEDKIMNITISNQQVKSYPRMLSAVAAALLLLVFGMVLVTMLAMPIGNNFGQSVELTQAPLKAGCQLNSTAAASDESLRLAQSAYEAFNADESDTELGILLAICALQTDYTPEADTALQYLMSVSGTARSFLGNGGKSGLFSPDGRYLVTSDNALLRLWDGETGAPMREIAVPTESITALAFSPDGRYILYGGADNTVRMLDVETGQEIRQFLHTHIVTTVAFSPDGHFVLSVPEESPDHIVYLWDAVTGEEIRQLTGHTSDIFDAAFSPDGRFIATSSWDTTVRLWDVATGDEVRQYPRHNSWAAHVSFSADGKYLLSSGTYVVRLSDVESGETIREYEAQGSRALGYPSFSPDRRYVLASDRDSIRALLWDADTDELIRIFDGRFFDPDAGRMYGVNFSPDGRTIVIENANAYGASPYNRVWLWDTDYRDTIDRACQGISRDFTPEERAQYGLREDVPTCPQFGVGYALEAGMTPIPTQPIPVWTPLPTLESTGG